MVIKDQKLISDIFSKGEKLYAGSFLCFIKKREDQKLFYAVAAGKKILKNAVKRNRAKRVLRSALFECLKDKNLQGMNIILVSLQDMSKIKSTEISNKLKSLL